MVKLFKIETDKIVSAKYMFSAVDYNNNSVTSALTSWYSDLSSLTTGSKMFYNCNKLETFYAKLGELAYGDEMFSGCSNLTSIVLPVSLASIEEQAFFGCSSLTTVYYMGASTDWGNISTVSNFYLTNANRYYYSKEKPALNTDSTDYNGNYWRYVEGIPTPWVYGE